MSYPFAPYNFDYNYFGALASYGTLNLAVTSPPQSFTEPLALTEVKDHLEMSSEDTTQDDMLFGFISAAREQAEICQHRDLVTKQYDLSLDYWTGEAIELNSPLVSVDSVKYKDSSGTVHTMAADTDYIVDTSKQPGLILSPYNKTWPSFTPWPSSAITIRFTSGLNDVSPFWIDSGARVKLGMKLLINQWYENRLPFVTGASAISEYPYGLTVLLSTGAVPRIP